MRPETKAWLERYQARERRHIGICRTEEKLHEMTVGEAIALVADTLGEEAADELIEVAGGLAKKIYDAEAKPW